MLITKIGSVTTSRLCTPAFTPGNVQSPSVTISAGYFFPSPGLNSLGIPTLRAYHSPIDGDWYMNDWIVDSPR